MDIRTFSAEFIEVENNPKSYNQKDSCKVTKSQKTSKNLKNNKFNMKTELIFILLSFLLISLNNLSAQEWNYYKYQTFNQLSGAGTNYQVRFTVHYGNGTDIGENVYLNSKCRTDFGDIRFFEGATELDYWMESKTDNDNAVFWVEIAGDLSSANRTVTLKYGNSFATTTSNGPNTFIFFDDFSNGLTKWTKEKDNSPSTITIPAGENYVRCAGGTTTSPHGHTVLGSSATYTGFANNAVEYRYRLATDAICEVGIRGDFGNNKGYKGRSDARTVSFGGSSILTPPYQLPWNSLSDAGEDLDPPSVDTWYRGTFTAYDSNLKLYRNDVLKRSSTQGSYTTAGEISLQNHYGSYTDYDWVAVRKFAGSEPVRGNWGGSNIWLYSKEQTINSLANTGTNYQVRFTVHYGNGTDSGENVYLNSKCRTDFGDIRFFEGATELDYWMESKTDSDNAVFWVEIASDLSSANRTVTLKYGNSFATTTSNGPNTFIFFDDFSNGLAKWTKEKDNSPSTITIPAGENYVRCGGGTTTSPYGHTVLGSSATYTGFANNAVEYRYRLATNAICEVGIRGDFSTNQGYKGRSDARTGQGSSILTLPYQGWSFLSDAGADSDVPSANTWYRGTFTAFGSNLKLYRDNVLKRSSTQGSYTTAGEISLQNHYGSYTDYDWVAVRKFADSEPTHGSWGSEQTLYYPLIEVSTTSLTNFTYRKGYGPSAVQEFAVTGSDLSASISIYAPNDFEISTQNGANFSPQNPIVLALGKGIVNTQTIYVRLKAGLDYGTYNESISLSSNGATSKSVSCSGVVTADYPNNTPVVENGVTITVSGGDAFKGSGVIPDIPNPNIQEYTSFIFLLDTIITSWTITMETNAAYGAYYQNGSWHLGERQENNIIVFHINFGEAKENAEIAIILCDLDPTLPVELSAFTASVNSQNGINIMWVTQSETGVNGYYVQRGIVDDLAQATVISPLIRATNTSQMQLYLYTDKEIYEPGTYYYWLEAQDYDGFVRYYGSRSIYFGGTYNGSPEIPLVTGIRSIYPNPFNPTATIMYELKDRSTVKIDIYNFKGQWMCTLVNDIKDKGRYRLVWDGTNNNNQLCGSGVYYIRMQAGEEKFYKKITLLK